TRKGSRAEPRNEVGGRREESLVVDGCPRERAGAPAATYRSVAAGRSCGGRHGKSLDEWEGRRTHRAGRRDSGGPPDDRGVRADHAQVARVARPALLPRSGRRKGVAAVLASAPSGGEVAV